MGDLTSRLLDLDARHTLLLEQLAELDQQIQEILDDWVKTKEAVAFEAHQIEAAEMKAA